MTLTPISGGGEPAVFVPFDRPFDLLGGAGAEDVAGVREARDGNGLRFERDDGHRRRGGRQAKDGEAEQGQTGGCSAHQNFLLCLMDRSASIRVAPEPCRSGDIEIPGNWPGNSGDSGPPPYTVATDDFKLDNPRPSDKLLSSVRASLQPEGQGRLLTARARRPRSARRPARGSPAAAPPPRVRPDIALRPSRSAIRTIAAASPCGAVDRIARSHVEGRVGGVRVEPRLRPPGSSAPRAPRAASRCDR